MKKTLIILLCLFSLNTLTYASFPITDSSSSEVEIAQGVFDDNDTADIELIVPCLDFTNEINEVINTSKLIKIIDVLGREKKQTNQLLFYIYNDGTVEKKIIIE